MGYPDALLKGVFQHPATAPVESVTVPESRPSWAESMAHPIHNIPKNRIKRDMIFLI
jgi:hypothetical protein